MKLVYQLMSSFFLLCFASCIDLGQRYWELSKFKISENALSNGDELKLLYYSGGDLTNKLDPKAYIHFIAVAVYSGDTVNILAKPPIKSYTKAELQETYYFYDKNSLVYKQYLMPDKIIESISNWDNVVDNKTKVCRDPKFDDLADNNYPSIIGCVLTK